MITHQLFVFTSDTHYYYYYQC